MVGANQHRQHLADANFLNFCNISDANAPNRHEQNFPVELRMATSVVQSVIADEFPTAYIAAIILLA
jgi:hypothetical protein